jgi:hypothetical protein
MPSDREAIESPITQGVTEESRCYTFPFSATPVNPAVKIYDETLADVSSTCLSGSLSISGNNVITPFVVDLEFGKTYYLACHADIGASRKGGFVRILAEFP